MLDTEKWKRIRKQEEREKEIRKPILVENFYLARLLCAIKTQLYESNNTEEFWIRLRKAKEQVEKSSAESEEEIPIGFFKKYLEEID